MLADVPRLLPRNRSRRRVHRASVYRWTKVGLQGIRLRSFRIGGRLATTCEELDRFFAAVTDRWDCAESEPGLERLRARGLA